MQKTFRTLSYFSYLILFLDAISFILSFNLSYWVWLGKMHPELALEPEIVLLLFLYFIVALIFNSHRPKARQRKTTFLFKFLITLLFTLFLAIVFLFISPSRYEGDILGRGPFLLGFIFFFLIGFLYRYLLVLLAKRQLKPVRMLYFSSLKVSEQFLFDLEKLSFPLRITLLYDPQIGKTKIGLKKIEELSASRLIEKSESWDKFQDVVATDLSSYDVSVLGLQQTFPDTLINSLLEAKLKGHQVFDLTDFYEMTFSKIPIFHLREGWFIFSQGFNLLHSEISLKIKRLLDITLAVLLSVLTFPVLILTSFLIKLDSRGPIIYAQERSGLNNEPFILLKFRSMRADAEREGAQWASKQDKRVTRVGRFIRLVRIDELPQLWNVLRGDMSFIGPRPERPVFNQELEKEIPFYNLRHLVKPGITGWAQVLYPYGASVADAREKLQYDLYYIKNYSLLLDFVIIVKTIRIVLFGKGR